MYINLSTFWVKIYYCNAGWDVRPLDNKVLEGLPSSCPLPKRLAKHRCILELMDKPLLAKRWHDLA